MTELLRVKVVPGASRDAIAGWLDDRLKIRVAAPPEKGRANRSVLRLLAGVLDISENRLCIVEGETSVRKTVAIEGVSADRLREKLPGK